jgi:UDPglucose 6-dehydrogenase
MEKEIKPCVVGLGKLGLPLAAVISDAGFQTVGIDLNPELISLIKSEEYKSPEPGLNDLLSKNSDNLQFSSDFALSRHCTIYFLIVPTPSMSDGKFDNSFLVDAITKLLDQWRELSGQKTIVIVSTVMPGSCLETFIPIIRKWEQNYGNRMKVNLLYSPEFIALGSVIHNLRNPDMTLIGCESESEAKSFLEIMGRVTTDKVESQILNLHEAEVVKIMVNCFVTMKISFANFIGEVSSLLPNTSKYKISNALGMDSRIGIKYLRPGLGFAGPCFPRDNKALIAFSQDLGIKASLALATDDINARQPGIVLRQVLQRFPHAKTIGIVGITYKPNTSVIEESQTLKIANLAKNLGLFVHLIDPLLSPADFSDFQVDNQVTNLGSYDAIIVPKEFEFLIDSKFKDLPKILVI